MKNANEKLDANMHRIWEIATKYKKEKKYKNIPTSIFVEVGTKALMEEIENSPDGMNVEDYMGIVEKTMIDVSHFLYQLTKLNEPAKKERLCLKAVKKDVDVLEYVPENLKTYEMYLEAVKKNGYALGLVPEDLKTAELCLEAIEHSEQWSKKFDENDWLGYDFVDDELDELELKLLKTDVLKYVPEKLKTAEFCFEAIKRNTSTIADIPKSLITAELCNVAIKQNGRALLFVPEEFLTYEMCLIAVKDYGKALKSVPETIKTKEFCLEAVKHRSWALKFVPENLRTYEMYLEAVKQDAGIFQYVPEEFKSTEICLEAVKVAGWLFFDVPEKFKNLEMCIAAVKQEYWLFMLVPESLKEQVIEATGIYGGTKENISTQEKEIFEKEAERTIIKLTGFCETARREGLLALKKYIDKEQLSKKALLETSVKMPVDGKKHEIIEKYIDSWIEANCVANYEKILASIIKTGVLCLQRGDNPKVAEYKMTVLIPRDLIPDTLLPESEKYFRRQKFFYLNPKCS